MSNHDEAHQIRTNIATTAKWIIQESAADVPAEAAIAQAARAALEWADGDHSDSAPANQGSYLRTVELLPKVREIATDVLRDHSAGHYEGIARTLQVLDSRHARNLYDAHPDSR